VGSQGIVCSAVPDSTILSAFAIPGAAIAFPAKNVFPKEVVADAVTPRFFIN
jgi:hypothetical protein